MDFYAIFMLFEDFLEKLFYSIFMLKKQNKKTANLGALPPPPP